MVGGTVAAGVVAALALAAVNARSTAAAALNVVPVAAAEGIAVPVGPKGEYSPPLRPPPETNLYWGDTHLHTRNSADAFSVGNEAVTPEDAFRFARGETVVATTGVRAKLRRPLDFLAVSDHAEYMGIYARLKAGGDARLETWEVGRQWGELLRRRDPREAAVPLGHRHDDDNQVLGLSGSQAAVPIWGQFMKGALAGHTSQSFKAPGGVTWAEVDPTTGKLAAPFCPRIIRSPFLDGTEPADSCEEHKF